MRVAFVATLAHSASVRRLAGVGPLVPGNVALAAERSGAHRARGEMGAGASSSAPQVGLTMLCPFESIQAVHRPFHDPLQTAHTLHPLFFLCSFRPTWCHHRPIWHLPTSAAVGEQRHPAQQPGGRDGPVLYARVPSMVSNGAVRLLKPTQVTPVACSFQLDTPVRGWRGEGQSQETGMFTIAYE